MVKKQDFFKTFSSDAVSVQVWSMDKNEPIYLVKSERMKRPTCLAWYLFGDSITESSWTLIAWLKTF